MLSLLFLASIIIMPFALSTCGMNAFHMSPAVNGFCANGLNISHLTLMRSLLIFGLIASVIVLTALILKNKLFSLLAEIKSSLEKNQLFNFLKYCLAGKLKPFDSLALAYSSGLVQPKTFWAK